MKYKRTWCDYLTACPFKNPNQYQSGIMVGSYECSQCKFHNGMSDNISNIQKLPCDYSHYTEVYFGEVICTKELNNN